MADRIRFAAQCCRAPNPENAGSEVILRRSVIEDKFYFREDLIHIKTVFHEH